MGSPLKANLPMDVIATRDIAQYAIKRLLALDFKDKSHQDLLGTRTVSYAEMTKVYGAAIGKKDLQYVEFSFDDFKKALIENMGTSENVADNFNAFIKAANDGKVMIAKRTTESTTPTAIEDFAHTFAFIYQQ